MEPRTSYTPAVYTVAHGDPLAPEHAAVAEWLAEVIPSLGRYVYWGDVPLESLPAGKRLLEADARRAARIVRAAVEQARDFDKRMPRMPRSKTGESPDGYSEGHVMEITRLHAAAVVRRLMRRTLPFEREDLMAMLQWCRGARRIAAAFAPLPSIVAALKRHAEKHPADPELSRAMAFFARQLRDANESPIVKLAGTVERLCGGPPAH